MQLQSVRFTGQRLIEGYGDGGFRLTDRRFEGALRILPERIDTLDCATVDELTHDHLSEFIIAKEQIELVLLGTGPRQQFPAPDLRQWFMAEGMALEAMDTGAACRTYNVLVSEDRRVAALLLPV